MAIVFSEASGLNDSIYGKCQAPIRMFIEQRGEDFKKNSRLNDLFSMESSENYADTLSAMTGMDGFDPVGENGAYPADSMQEGHKKVIEQMTWKDSFSISQEIIEDAKIYDMKKQPAAFMTGYQRTREKFGAALYGAALGTGTSFTYRGKTFDCSCADGKALFATNHDAVVKGAAQTNRFTDAFSVDALDKAESKMHLFRGDDNEILDVAPDTILIPDDPSLKRAVFAAIGSDQDPATANNAFNYQYGRWNVIIWAYLNQFVASGTSPWILMDSNYNKTYRGAVWLDRVELAIKSTIDDNTDANVWRGRSRFNATFNDWRFALLGGVASGSTL